MYVDTDQFLWLFGWGCFILLVLLAVFGLYVWLPASQCDIKFTDFEHKYSIIGGCMVKPEDKWIPSDSYYYEEE